MFYEWIMICSYSQGLCGLSLVTPDTVVVSWWVGYTGIWFMALNEHCLTALTTNQIIVLG